MSDAAELVTPPVVFSGEAFSSARQKLDLSSEQVARQLHLSTAIIDAIEQADFDRLKDPVFSRGYVRAYARFLKLDADAQVQAYNQQVGDLAACPGVKSIGTVSTVPGRRHGHPVLKLGSWLFVVALVAACLWWWQAQFGFDADERPPLDDQPVSVETTDGTTLVLPQLDATEEPSDLPVDAQSVIELSSEDGITQGSTERESDAVPAGEQAESTEAASAIAAGSSQDDITGGEEAEPAAGITATDFSGLALSFSEDCWLSVKDARGRTLYSGVAKGGSSLELEGAEPLAVVIGRASAIAGIHYANQAIDLSAHSKENVARLRLPM